MYAEKFTLHTDNLGRLMGLPPLPPDMTVELIVLFQQPARTTDKLRRSPPPELKGKIKILGDIVSPVVTEDEWDALQ